METVNKTSWGILISALLAGICFGLVLARFIPELIDLHPMMWVVLGVLFALKPMGSHFLRKPTTT